MLESLAIGDKLMEVRMILDPHERVNPVISELTITSVSSEEVHVEGSYVLRNTYKRSEIGTILNGLFKDRITWMERIGICLQGNLESFKMEMLDSLHADLVRYRFAMLEMQKDLNRHFLQEPDETLAVDWDRYRCVAVSEWSQNIYPIVGQELEWSSTNNTGDVIFISVEDKEKGNQFEVRGLEGLDNETKIINQLKKAIVAYERRFNG